MAGRPRKQPSPIIERLDLPGDMTRRLTDLSNRRAWPLVADAIYCDRSLRKAVRDVYLQGLTDGYECAVRRLATHPLPHQGE